MSPRACLLPSLLLLTGCGWLLSPGGDTDATDDTDPPAEDIPPDADTPVVFETATAGLCSNGTDDDGDGATDCEDPGCARSAACDPFGDRRDVVWPPDPPELDLVRDERDSCEVPVDTEWLCGRGTTGRWVAAGGVRGARPGPDATLHLVTENADGLAYRILEDGRQAPFGGVTPSPGTLVPVADPADPTAPVACGPVLDPVHPLSAGALTWRQEPDGRWSPEDATLWTVQTLTSPMVPEHCDARVDDRINVVSYRDTTDPDRATVVLTGPGLDRVLIPELLGRDSRVFVEADGDDTWIAVSNEGSCTVPCVFRLRDGSVLLERMSGWGPSWQEPILPVSERAEPGSFWIDDEGVPTVTWSGLTQANEQVRGVARWVDGGWTGRELKCPQDRVDRPDLSAVADLGEVWATGGIGYLYLVDPDTLLATRLDIPGDWSFHPIDVIVERGPGRFTPQGEIWASSRRAQDDDTLPILRCRPR